MARRRSQIWNHFSTSEDKKAKCLYCLKELSFDNGALSNLSRHMQRKHPEISLNSENPENEPLIPRLRIKPISLPIDLKSIEDEIETQQCEARNATKRKGKRRSKVWNHFDKTTNKRAKCSYCMKTISFEHGSLSNLVRHLQRKHPSVSLTSGQADSDVEKEEVAPPGKNKPEEAVNGSRLTGNCKPVSSDRGRRYDEQFLKMLTKKYHHFSLVEDEGFVQFVKALCPGYRLPTRKNLSRNLLPQYFNKTIKKMKNKLCESEAVCITADTWVNSTRQSFLAITSYFINLNCELDSTMLACIELPEDYSTEDLSNLLKQNIVDWGLENKVIAAVTDNSASLIAGVQQCSWQRLPCFGHVLNDIVQSGLQELAVQTTIQKIRIIVENFNRSSVALAKLRSLQNEMGLPELKLKHDVSPVWTTTYEMLKRVVQMKDAIISTLAYFESNLETLTLNEWKIAECAMRVLELFQQVTDEISSEKMVSLSKVILFVRVISKRVMALETSFPPEVCTLIHMLQQQMEEQLTVIMENELSIQATILDPRFKKHGLDNEEKFNLAYESLKSIVCNIILESDKVNTPGSVITEAAKDDENEDISLWDDFDTEVEEVMEQEQISAGIIELNKYLQEPVLDRREDPMKWWRERRCIYPRLYEIVKRRLCLIATCIPCEDIFSKNGQLVAERKCRIKASKVSQIVFLSHNL